MAEKRSKTAGRAAESADLDLFRLTNHKINQ